MNTRMEMEEGLVWQSLAYMDGTKYNGLTKGGKLHSHGVLTFPNKDRYEGMFEDGKMHGSGVYVWSTGMIYRGDWTQGIMHGCGTGVWKQGDGSVAAAEGKFFGDEFVGDIMPCSTGDALDSAVEADMAAFQARSFLQWPGRQQNHNQQWQAKAGRSRQQAPAAEQRLQQHWRGALSQSNTAAVAAGGSARPGNAAAADQQQEQRLQSLVQRLMADKVAEAKRPPG